jgi:hypothetical protein
MMHPIKIILLAFLAVAVIAIAALAQDAPRRPHVNYPADHARVPTAIGYRVETVRLPPKTDVRVNGARVASLRAGIQAASVEPPEGVRPTAGRTRMPYGTIDPTAQTVGRLTGPVEAPAVDATGFIGLLLAAEDERGLRQLLGDEGVTFREARTPIRKLPKFLRAFCCAPGTPFDPVEVEHLPQLPAPDGIKVVRYLAGAKEAVAYVAAHPNERFLVVADIRSVSAEALKSLGGGNIVAVVAGHYSAADAKPRDFQQAAAEALQVRRAIRMVSDAPVLLAVSMTNWHSRTREPGWAAAFGEDLADFDGWGIYNLTGFAAVLEADGNPRLAACKALGLDPAKPCILMDFVGTASLEAKRHDYIRKVWGAKWPLLREAIGDQGWRGIVLHTSDPLDAKLKAEVLTEPESEEQAAQ